MENNKDVGDMHFPWIQLMLELYCCSLFISMSPCSCSVYLGERCMYQVSYLNLLWKWLFYLYNCFRDSFRQLWEEKPAAHAQNTISILFTPFVY